MDGCSCGGRRGIGGAAVAVAIVEVDFAIGWGGRSLVAVVVAAVLMVVIGVFLLAELAGVLVDFVVVPQRWYGDTVIFA